MYIYITYITYIYIPYIYICIVGQLPLGSTPDAVLASKGFRCCSGSRTPQDLETLRRSHGIQVSLADVGETITGCWFQRRNILKWPSRNSWFTHEKWWCPLIFHSYVNVYQRVPLKNESGWWFQSSWKNMKVNGRIIPYMKWKITNAPKHQPGNKPSPKSPEIGFVAVISVVDLD